VVVAPIAVAAVVGGLGMGVAAAAVILVGRVIWIAGGPKRNIAHLIAMQGRSMRDRNKTTRRRLNGKRYEREGGTP